MITPVNIRRLMRRFINHHGAADTREFIDLVVKAYPKINRYQVAANLRWAEYEKRISIKTNVPFVQSDMT